MGHAHNVIVNRQIVDVAGVEAIRKQARSTRE